MNWMLSALFAATANAIAQQPAPAVEMTPAETAFQQMLTNVVLEGFFTVGNGTELFPIVTSSTASRR